LAIQQLRHSLLQFDSRQRRRHRRVLRRQNRHLLPQDIQRLELSPEQPSQQILMP
jgi:hypothetical protein